MKALYSMLALSLFACAPPDPRIADVIFYHQHEPEIRSSIDFWQRAGAGLDWRLKDHCEDKKNRQCVEIVFGQIDTDVKKGVCDRHYYDGYPFGGDREAFILVDASLDPFSLQQVLTHEIGHALGLRHVVDDVDVMRGGGLGSYCVGPKTREIWKFMYGDDLKEECVEEPAIQ